MLREVPLYMENRKQKKEGEGDGWVENHKARN